MTDRNSSQSEPTVQFKPEQQRTVPYKRPDQPDQPDQQLEQQQTIQFDRVQRDQPPQPNRGKVPLLLGALFLALGVIGLGVFLLLSGNDVETESTQATSVPTADSDTGDASLDDNTIDERASVVSGIVIEPDGAMPSIDMVEANLFDIPAPDGTMFVSDIYTIDRDGARDGVVQIDIPADAGDIRTLDLVVLTENGWQMRPSIVRNDTVETSGELAAAFALVQSPQGFVSYAAERSPDTVLPNTLGELFGERSIGAFVMQDDGLLTTPVPSVPVDGLYYLHVVNGLNEVDENATLSLLINPEVQESHITTLVNLASSKQYDGVHIDYQQIPEDMRDSFTDFLRELKDSLDDAGLALVVSLEYPTLSAGLWDSAGQNWTEIGNLATVVFAEMPLDPTIYTDNGEVDQFVQWATRQIDRRKLMLSYTANGVDSTDGVFTALPNSALIEQFGSVNGRIDDDGQVVLRLNGSAQTLEWDGFAVTYKFNWKDAGKTHTAWLANEAVLAYRLRLVKRYGVRGVTLRDLGDEQNTLSYRTALGSVAEDAELPPANASAIIWSVAKSDGSLVASGTAEGDDPTRFTWFTEGRGGLYGITADFFIGDQSYLLGEYVADLGEGDGTEFEALPDSTATAEAAEGETEAETEDEDEADVETEVTTVSGTTIGRLNFRSAPTMSGSQITLLLPDTPLELFGRSADDLWYNVRVDLGDLGDADVREGWVWAEFVTVSRQQADLLPVTE